MAASNTRIDFHTIPAGALNFRTRGILSRMLNPIQELTTLTGLMRDFRGLAELMNFDYWDIQNFQMTSDPFAKLLIQWTDSQPANTVGKLFDLLEEIERTDVIDDVKQYAEIDACNYLERKKKWCDKESPLQDPEVSSCARSAFPADHPDHLTVDDVTSNDCKGQEVSLYDAYVCYTDEDIECVHILSRQLESEGIRLFIRDRDLLLGQMEYEAFARLIDERCNRVLIVLSPEFLKSVECEFQTRYATSLAVEQQQRKLIPIIYKSCDIPHLLRYLSKIDFTKLYIHDWVWHRLIHSIKGEGGREFTSSVSEQPSVSNSRPPTYATSVPLSAKNNPSDVQTQNDNRSWCGDKREMSLVPGTSASSLNTSGKSVFHTRLKFFKPWKLKHKRSSETSVATSGYCSDGQISDTSTGDINTDVT